MVSLDYHSDEYVKVLVNDIIGDNGENNTLLLSRIKYCFLATDDYSVVYPELQESLKKHNMPCTLYAIQDPYHRDNNNNGNDNNMDISSHRRDYYDMILFLIEMKILSNVTYFIGTFNSNVSGIISLYRGCKYHTTNTDDSDSNSNNWKYVHPPRPRPNPAATQRDISIDTKFDHYYQSYGVDSNDWFIQV